MEPLVSIITPVYNAEKYIKDCIESVLSQTYSNWELILVDDCSSDKSVNVIEHYLSDTRIKLYKNTNNSGPAVTRNVALNKYSGEYITFLDSDDFWEKEKLAKQVRFMQDNKIDMSHGHYYFCDIYGGVIKKIITDKKISYLDLLKGNQFKIMTLMLSRKLVSDFRFEDIKHEDFAYFLDCLKRIDYSLSYTNDVDSYCRVGKVSVSSNKIKSALWTWKIFRQQQKLGFFISLKNFVFYAFNGIVKHKKHRRL